MNGKLKEKQLKSSDLDFSVQSIKFELAQSIDTESKRVNIDSAKKKAVLYGMDYDGFHQMVLGANLFSIKSRDLINLTAESIRNKRNDIVLNSNLTTFNNVIDLSTQKQEEITLINMKIAQMLSNSELQVNSFREFKKIFDQQYKEEMDEIAAQNIYLIFKSQKPENIKKIFSLDFDVCYFFKILNVFQYIINKSLIPNKNIIEFQFVIQFICQFTEIKDFQFIVPKFLNKKEKILVKEFMSFLKESINLLEMKSNDDTDIVEYFNKINNYYSR